MKKFLPTRPALTQLFSFPFFANLTIFCNPSLCIELRGIAQDGQVCLLLLTARSSPTPFDTVIVVILPCLVALQGLHRCYHYSICYLVCVGVPDLAGYVRLIVG